MGFVSYLVTYKTHVTEIREDGIGDIKALSCNVTREGKPNLVIDYTWTKDGETLSDHSGTVINGSRLIFKVNRQFCTQQGSPLQT